VWEGPLTRLASRKSARKSTPDQVGGRLSPRKRGEVEQAALLCLNVSEAASGEQAMTYDAIVIGAGPAGATAALMLAQAGWRVAIVEKAVFPRRKVCGEFISATSLPLLHALGIGESFLAQAGPEVRRVGLFAGEVTVTAPMPSGSAAPWGRALGREHLDPMLLEAAVRAGAKLWQPFAVTQLRCGTRGYACTLDAETGRTEIVGRLVIVAAGSWERNDWAQVTPAPHRPSDLLAFKAHFADANLPADLMPLLAFAGGYGGMVHSDAGRVTLSCCIRRDALQACRQRHRAPSAGDAVLRHIQDSCAGVRDALRSARLAGPWLAAGPIRPGLRRRHAGGIFFVGNIAGEAHPIVAEGISMAMQSAWLLCRHLTAHQQDVVAGRALTPVARAYDAEWRASFSARVRFAAAVAHVAMRPYPGRSLLPLIRRCPAILTLGARWGGKARQVVAA